MLSWHQYLITFPRQDLVQTIFDGNSFSEVPQYLFGSRHWAPTFQKNHLSCQGYNFRLFRIPYVTRGKRPIFDWWSAVMTSTASFNQCVWYPPKKKKKKWWKYNIVTKYSEFFVGKEKGVSFLFKKNLMSLFFNHLPLPRVFGEIFSPDLSQPYQGTPDAIIHLVDEATAEPLVCELETMSLGEKDPGSEMVLTKETWKLANSTGIFGQHSWSGLLGDEFKLPVGRISATKKTPFVPMWPSTFGFLGFYGWNHGDWPHGNPAKKQVAKVAKNLVKHFPFIDVWWYAQWKRCSRYFY